MSTTSAELLQKINEFSVDKSLVIEGNTYEEFQTVVEKQTNFFLKMFFHYKIDEQDQIKLEEQSKVTYSEVSLLSPALCLKVFKGEITLEPELLGYLFSKVAVPQLRPCFMNSKFLKTLRFGLKLFF